MANMKSESNSLVLNILCNQFPSSKLIINKLLHSLKLLHGKKNSYNCILENPYFKILLR